MEDEDERDLWIYNKNKSVLRFVSFHESSGEILCKVHLILSQMYVQSFLWNATNPVLSSDIEILS